MVDVRVESAPAGGDLEASLQSQLNRLQQDAVVRVRLEGPWSDGARTALTAKNLRRLAPETMNISLHPQAG